MCRRCAELLAENARLKDMLEVRSRADLIGRLKAYLGVTEGQARLLLRLYRERGGLVGHKELHDSVPIRYRAGPQDRGEQFLRVMFMQTRRKLPPACVETVRGYGYRLTPVGVDLVVDALRGDGWRQEAA